MSTKLVAMDTPASRFYKSVVDLSTNLYTRWLDESQHEDSEEYLAVFRKHAKKHGIFVTKLTKRPWGILFNDGTRFYELTVTTKQVAYKRIK